MRRIWQWLLGMVRRGRQWLRRTFRRRKKLADDGEFGELPDFEGPDETGDDGAPEGEESPGEREESATEDAWQPDAGEDSVSGDMPSMPAESSSASANPDLTEEEQNTPSGVVRGSDAIQPAESGRAPAWPPDPGEAPGARAAGQPLSESDVDVVDVAETQQPTPTERIERVRSEWQAGAERSRNRIEEIRVERQQAALRTRGKINELREARGEQPLPEPAGDSAAPVDDSVSESRLPSSQGEPVFEELNRESRREAASEKRTADRRARQLAITNRVRARKGLPPIQPIQQPGSDGTPSQVAAGEANIENTPSPEEMVQLQAASRKEYRQGRLRSRGVVVRDQNPKAPEGSGPMKMPPPKAGAGASGVIEQVEATSEPERPQTKRAIGVQELGDLATEQVGGVGLPSPRSRSPRADAESALTSSRQDDRKLDEIISKLEDLIRKVDRIESDGMAPILRS